jgi:hypothetical protein
MTIFIGGEENGELKENARWTMFARVNTTRPFSSTRLLRS